MGGALLAIGAVAFFGMLVISICWNGQFRPPSAARAVLGGVAVVAWLALGVPVGMNIYASTPETKIEPRCVDLYDGRQTECGDEQVILDEHNTWSAWTGGIMFGFAAATGVAFAGDKLLSRREQRPA